MICLNNICIIAIIIICNLSTITVLSLHCRSIDNRNIVNSSSPSPSGDLIDHSWNRYINEVYDNDDSPNATTTTITTTTRDNSSFGPYLVNKTDIQFFYKNAKVKLRSLDWPTQTVFNSGLQGIYIGIVEKFWTGYSSERFIAADYSWVEVQRFKVGPSLLLRSLLLSLQLLVLIDCKHYPSIHLSYSSTIYSIIPINHLSYSSIHLS
jgi:hypothetical protein